MMITLTNEQKEYFNKNGFLIVENVLTAQEVEEFRQGLDIAINSESKLSLNLSIYGGNLYQQKVNLWRDYPEVRRFSLDPRFAEIAKQLTGAKQIRLFHDHYLIKSGEKVEASPWHQDFTAWPIDDQGSVNCWITLDDVGQQNGALAYIPGSHRFGVVDPHDFGDRQVFALDIAGKSKEELTPVIAEMKAGSCVFHHAHTLHFAFPNQTKQPRRAITNVFFPDWLTYNGNRHPVTDDQGLEVGKPFDHELFPVLA